MNADELLQIQEAFDKSVDRMFKNFKEDAFDPLRDTVNTTGKKVGNLAERMSNVETALENKGNCEGNLNRITALEDEAKNNRRSLWGLLVGFLLSALGAVWAFIKSGGQGMQ